MADQNLNNMTVVWNSGATTFAAVKMNVTDTASAIGSMLLQFQVGGVDKFKVGKDGSITGAGPLSITGNSTITGNLNVSGTLTAGGITGSMTGPASSTDRAVPRFNGLTGTTLRNSGVIIDDANNVTGVASLSVAGNITTTAGGIQLGGGGAFGTNSLTLALRPNGIASATGQMTIATTGAVTINGTLTVTG